MHCSHANVRVRNSNLKKQKDDWDSYLDKWSGIFYDPEKKNAGGWIEKEFHDPHLTAKAFDVCLAEEASMVRRILGRMKAGGRKA